MSIHATCDCGKSVEIGTPCKVCDAMAYADSWMKENEGLMDDLSQLEEAEKKSRTVAQGVWERARGLQQAILGGYDVDESPVDAIEEALRAARAEALKPIVDYVAAQDDGAIAEAVKDTILSLARESGDSKP